MQCTAKSKQSGEQCKKHAMVGRNVCATHGGKTPRGIASPHFKTGRQSKYMPAWLRERYEAHLADPNLLSMADDVALLDARADELLEALATGNTADVWERLQETFAKFDTALHTNPANAQRHLVDLRGIVQEGGRAAETWQELYVLLEQRRKIAESEHKRLVSMDQMVTAGEVMALMMQVMDVIVRVVSDPRERAEVGRVILDITNRPGLGEG